MRVSDARLLAWANVTHPKNEMDDMALDLIDARERIAELEASYQIALGTAARMREANSRVLQQAQAGQTRICNQRKELHRQGQRIAELEKDAERLNEIAKGDYTLLKLGENWHYADHTGYNPRQVLDRFIAAQRQKEGK